MFKLKIEVEVSSWSQKDPELIFSHGYNKFLATYRIIFKEKDLSTAHSIT